MIRVAPKDSPYYAALRRDAARWTQAFLTHGEDDHTACYPLPYLTEAAR